MSESLTALFDAVDLVRHPVPGLIERVPLDQLELAPNHRKAIDQEGIHRLAHMLASTGQLTPCIGRRMADHRVMLYAGQRRLLAARASHELAGSPDFEGLAPVTSLIVLLLDHEPGDDEIRRIQAQENAREPLSLRDQQEQFRDCWQARAGLPDADRMAVVCADLGITTGKGHSLRRQLVLPEAIRDRIAERPAGDQLSVRMAHRLADMHDVAPELTEAVAARVTTGELHDQALRDLGGFVHRTVVENEHVYALRIDDGVLLDGAEQVEHARNHLTAERHAEAAAALGCEPEKLDSELDALAARAKSSALKLRVDGTLRDRAANGRYGWVFERGQDFAAGIWVIDPVFMLDAVRHQLADADGEPAREEAYFGGARLDDDELRDAAEQDRQRRAAERARHAEATASNLTLGHDIRAALADPSDDQLSALREIVCRLVCEHHPELIAYGAGWTDAERQQPVGDTGRREPRHLDAIVQEELRRALEDPDPLHGIAQLLARWGAAFMLDPDGVTRTKALGSERMARKLRDALPGGEQPLRAALWAFMRPILSPRLVELNKDAFVFDADVDSSVDLAAHRADSDLDDIDLGDDGEAAA
jgi:ParB/Sulfiredoxin domain